MKFRVILVVGLIFLALVAGATIAWARTQTPTVTRVVVIAKPRNYKGPCPIPVEFTGTIFVSHPAKVAYRWERSDGGTGARQVVDIRSAGQGVTDTWRLGVPGKTFDGWVRLHVLAPTGIASNDATFEVHCR